MEGEGAGVIGNESVKSVNLWRGREGSRGGRAAALLLTELERRHVCSGDPE